MVQRALQVLFCGKIEMELQEFKDETLRLDAGEIFQKAYEIDCKISIYELLLEISRELSDDILQVMLSLPDVLGYLYFRWLKTEDSHTEELWQFLSANLGIEEKDIVTEINEKNKEAI